MVDTEKIEQLTRDLLIAIGEDPERDGLKQTPARVARFWGEFIDYEPGRIATTFENGSSDHVDQMVVIGPMRVWSLCEHHMIPFYTDVVVAYVPDGCILGLSKFARIAHQHSHKLNVQERMVADIAQSIVNLAKTENVAVTGYGEHLCMTMRGIRTPSKTVSSVVRGLFRTSSAARKEFFDIAKGLQG